MTIYTILHVSATGYAYTTSYKDKAAAIDAAKAMAEEAYPDGDMTPAEMDNAVFVLKPVEDDVFIVKEAKLR